MAADAGFTEARARAVLAAALPGGTDDAAGARLLALGENAVFALDRLSLVVRVSRDLAVRERAARELRVADWLAREGVPAVRPDRRFGGADQPLAYDGHLVTYWQQLPPPERPAGPRDLAALLRRVHALPEPPPDLALPRRDLLGGVDRWLRLAGEAIDPADAAYLRARRDDIAAATAELTPHLAPGPIHGDALPRNVHIGPDGPVLVDLETFATDLREHDLVVMALFRDRYGLGAAAYDEFSAAYGWDVREWPGCAVLRGARETASCAWVAQHAPGNPAALAEFRRRVASLREGDAAVRWYAF
ncbi:phosphotransferase enzyme family protein [Streptomyces sp. NPDC021098]|uniref:phosphotransferase enzyme family protein n=1 Tax=unclassified Streptomyces TaxID=2593676 RepID=UPI0037BAE65A